MIFVYVSRDNHNQGDNTVVYNHLHPTHTMASCIRRYIIAEQNSKIVKNNKAVIGTTAIATATTTCINESVTVVMAGRGG
jgi:hypothetical protein